MKIPHAICLLCGLLIIVATYTYASDDDKSSVSLTADVAPGVVARVTEGGAIGDTLFSFDVQNIGGPPANSQLGVEFAADHFWVTGRNTTDNIRKLYKFNRSGQLVASYLQGTISTFGWRDLAFDGTYLYASDENEFAKIDLNSGARVGTLPKPAGIAVLRGLAFDPASRHFWTKDFAGPLVEFDSLGAIINSFPNPTPAYGLAWDRWTPGGPFLWMWTQIGPQNGPLCTAIQVNPLTGAETGVRFTGVDFQPDSLNDLAGGATISKEFDSTKVVFIGLHQSQSDRVVGYDITILPPIPPILVSPADGATGMPINSMVSWDSVSGATMYHVQIATDSLFFSLTANDSLVNELSFDASPLLYYTTYFWRVRAKNMAGYGAYSPPRKFTTTLAAPVLVSPPDGASDLATTLDLTWNAVTGATAYRLQVAVDSLFQNAVFDDSLITGTSNQVGPLLDTTRYFWRVRGGNAGATGVWSAIRTFTTGVTLGVASESELPATFSLDQNYPNPFNPSTTIHYALPREIEVTIDVFNLIGQHVRTLVGGRQNAGYHTVSFSGAGLPSGLYYYTMRAGDFTATRRSLLLK